jgi:hypothetical protein
VSIADVRKAFNATTGGKMLCAVARLRYVPNNGHPNWQQLEFDGAKSDGTAFAITSDSIAPGKDLNSAAVATALKYLGTPST